MRQEVHPERGPVVAGQALSTASTHAHGHSTHCLWCRERTTKPYPQPAGTPAVCSGDFCNSDALGTCVAGAGMCV